jgi:hypothetical protein
LKKMEPIINDYFRYKSLDEIEEVHKQFENISEDDDQEEFNDSIDADDLFS